MLINRCKIKRWLGLLSQLSLCAAVLWPSPAVGAPITQKGAGAKIQVPAAAVQKKPSTQLEMVSAATAPGQNLKRNKPGDLTLYVEVRDTSKRTQTFYLKAELAGIPGDVEPSGRLVIGPLETRRFTYVLRGVNPGDRSGGFSGAVTLMNENRELVGNSRTFSYRVVDLRQAEDLKVDGVEIARVIYSNENRGGAKIKRIEYWVKISNVGRDIFGHRITLRTQLRIGKPDTGTRMISGGNTDRQWDVRSGIQPGEQVIVSGMNEQTGRSYVAGEWIPSSFQGTGPNLWHTLLLDLAATNDTYGGNNQMMYSFIVDNSGRVIASKVRYGPWPAARN